jgi:broad-specificity NMP kinase
MGKSKDIERNTAKIYYVDKLKTIEEILALLPISRRQLSEWINKYGWRQERDGRMNSNKSQIDRLRELIAIKAERAIIIERLLAKTQDPAEIELLRQQSVAISDEVSKWNKTLENINKNNKISLSAYIDIMDNIFKSMQNDIPEIYLKTIDFQEKHLAEISLKYE